MSWINCLWFLFFFIILHSEVQGHRTVQAFHHPRRRHLPWVKHLKNQHRHKYKSFKKHLKRCGFPPYNLQFLRKFDANNLDTIQVVVPYGYSGEYFPQRPRDIIPIEAKRSNSTKTGN
nr:PREDICTED: uncharacterized protein LOC107399203 [Tribolium castaneum]|eukprot:XP_015840451.1 PREDICTED: uncharacterized protein LOC107399203 [Tribolium castaneum]